MPKQGSKSGKNFKSSKTARVLSLLTDTSSAQNSNASEPTASESTAAAETGSKSSSAPKPKNTRQPPAVQRADDKEVELQIRSALEGALLAADPAAASRIQQEAANTASRVATQIHLEEEPVASAPQTETEIPEPTPVPPEPAPAPPQSLHEPKPFPLPELFEDPEPEQPEPSPMPIAPVVPSWPQATMPPAPPEEIDQNISCFNVMQSIVESKVDKYIHMYGVCSCSRCRVDVMALALTNLPAKYVVINDQERIPMLSVFEGRFNAAVITQIINACIKIKANPRHRKA